jgi:hypothetical protein
MTKINVYFELTMEIYHCGERQAKLSNTLDGLNVNSKMEHVECDDRDIRSLVYTNNETIYLVKNVPFDEFPKYKTYAKDLLMYFTIFDDHNEKCKRFFETFIKDPEVFISSTNMDTIKAVRKELKALDDKKYFPYEEAYRCSIFKPDIKFEFCKPEKKVTKKRKAVKK